MIEKPVREWGTIGQLMLFFLIWPVLGILVVVELYFHLFEIRHTCSWRGIF